MTRASHLRSWRLSTKVVDNISPLRQAARSADKAGDNIRSGAPAT